MADAERPQPAGKRRAGAQGGKDDPEEDEDAEVAQDPGAWKPVDGEVAKRRKVKVRRAGGGGEPEPAPAGASAEAAAAGSNPFAGVSLAAPSPAGANPFAGISLVTPAAAATPGTATPGEAAPAADADKGKEASTAAAASKEPAPAEAAVEIKEAKDAAPPSGTATPSGFGSFAAGSNPFAALTSSSKTGTGFGGFGGFNAAQRTPNVTPQATSTFTPLFGGGGSAAAAMSSGFSFGTSAFPNIATGGKAASAENGNEGAAAGEEENVELFNDSTAEFKPVVQLPDQKTVTGEEEESVAFTAESTLYEFEPASSKWRERGKGEFRLNLDKAGQARMVMRQSGNYRLLLNAKVYAGMALQRMAGDVGVTFACANVASADQAMPTPSPEKADASAAPASEAPSKLATWALKIKSKDTVMRLFELLGQHKEAAAAATATGA